MTLVLIVKVVVDARITHTVAVTAWPGDLYMNYLGFDLITG